MGMRIYNVNDTEEKYISYKVFINNSEVKLDCARVSANPINRRWPGHQRPINQTEMINFLSFATDEEVLIEIVPLEKFENVIIRPQSLGIKPKISDGKISFKLCKPAYFTVEPYGRHNALHIFADKISDYDIDITAENIIYYPAGIYEAGTIELKSNQILFIDEGALVYGSIKAFDAENIKIVGKGILDNSHNKEQILYKANEKNNSSAVKNAIRTHTIQMEYCKNVEIEGITIRNSLVYNIRPIACENLHIHNVKIIGCWRYNSDGIDMHNCENVLIENCFLRTFDDSICVKGFDCYYSGDVEKSVEEAMWHNGKKFDVFKNVEVRNCVIWNDWGKSLEIGAETRAEEIYNITFTDCDIIHLTGPALDCCNVDYAVIHDICYRNINIEYDDAIPAPFYQTQDDEVYINENTDYNPAAILAEVSFHQEYSAGGNRRGKNRNIVFQNINIISNKKPKFAFSGYNEEHKTKDVLMKDIFINGIKIKNETECDLKIFDNCENIVIK